MGNKKHIVNDLVIEQVREDLEKIIKRDSIPPEFRGIAGESLKKWVKVSDFIDTALLNHGYEKLTIPLTVRNKSIFLVFSLVKGKGWFYQGFRLGVKVGWGYKWEYNLDKDMPITRKRKTSEVRVKV